MRSPSSLIFLVLLGIWAAYFVQYWVRRRDHLATARSVEQFSAAMRVLERRDALPRTDLSEPAPRSYAVHPARTVRPQVLVKRAVAAEHTGPAGVTARVADPEGVAAPGTTRPAAPGTTRPAAPAATGPAAPAAPRAPASPRLRPSRRVRGLLVLASLAEMLVIVALVVFGMLPLWALAPAGLAVAATLTFLRSGVRAEQAMMRAHRRRQADLARLRATAPVTAPVGRRAGAPRPTSARPVATASAPASSSAGAENAQVDHPGGSTVAGEQAEPVVAASASSPLDVALEVEPATATATSEAPVAGVPAADVMVPIVDEDDIPLTWDPVPVPRPTYTMKAKAERREVPPAAVTPDPAPMARPDDGDDTAYDRRRVAGA